MQIGSRGHRRVTRGSPNRGELNRTVFSPGLNLVEQIFLPVTLVYWGHIFVLFFYFHVECTS